MRQEPRTKGRMKDQARSVAPLGVLTSHSRCYSRGSRYARKTIVLKIRNCRSSGSLSQDNIGRAMTAQNSSASSSDFQGPASWCHSPRSQRSTSQRYRGRQGAGGVAGSIPAGGQTGEAQGEAEWHLIQWPGSSYPILSYQKTHTTKLRKVHQVGNTSLYVWICVWIWICFHALYIQPAHVTNPPDPTPPLPCGPPLPC